MTIDVTGQDQLVISYILNWWWDHPEELAWLDKLDGRQEIDDYRYRLYDDLNAHTDGKLQTIVPRGDLSWIYLVGAATALTLKERK